MGSAVDQAWSQQETGAPPAGQLKGVNKGTVYTDVGMVRKGILVLRGQKPGGGTTPLWLKWKLKRPVRGCMQSTARQELGPWMEGTVNLQ